MNNDLYPVTVLAPCIGLAACCFIHIVLAKLRWGRPPYQALIAGFFSGLVATIAIASWPARRQGFFDSDRIALTALDTLTYTALGWCYFHFVNLGIASLRIRVLEEISEAGGVLHASELKHRYDDNQMARTRLQRLVAGGHLVCREGRFYSGRRGFLVVARIFDVLRRAVLGKDSALLASSQRMGSARGHVDD